MFKYLKNDIPASIVVFFVALPLCLGIALASDAPPLSGLISGIIGGVVVGFISKSKIGVSGPAAGLAAIVASAVEAAGKNANPATAVDSKTRAFAASEAAAQLQLKQRKSVAFINSIRNAPDSEKVMYMIPKIYDPFLKTMKVSLNGATIYLKADGVPRLLHKSYIPFIDKKLRHLDNKITAMNDKNDRANISQYSR